MQEAFKSYLNYLEAERNFSPYTVRNYRADLVDFFQFLKTQGVDSLGEVDKHVLRDYLSNLTDRKLVKASIARKMSALRSFFSYLVREGITDTNPAAAISSPKLEKRLPSFLTVAETVRLLTTPDLTKPEGLRDRALMEFLYACGIRVSELVSLNLEQVNLETGEIRVWGKGAKERVVLIGKPAAAALSTYISEGRSRLTGKKATSALFLNRYGERIITRQVEKIVEKYGRIAGIGKRVHPHLLRHTFATHLLDGGADLRVVQELLGHADLSSTQIYTHVTKSKAQKIYLSAHPMAREKGNESKE